MISRPFFTPGKMCMRVNLLLFQWPTPNFTFSVAGHQVGTKQEAKCLGCWWKSNLGSAKSVKANIEKGRKAFFAAGASYWCLSRNSKPSQFDILILHLCSPSRSLWVWKLDPYWANHCKTWNVSVPNGRILKIPKHCAIHESPNSH